MINSRSNWAMLAKNVRECRAPKFRTVFGRGPRAYRPLFFGVESGAPEADMETAAAILVKAIVDHSSALRALVGGISDPKGVEEILKPYYQAAFSLVKKVSREA
ncbi:MAG: hypothetical protein WA183_19345 [Chthoniobacterales bacterium]